MGERDIWRFTATFSDHVFEAGGVSRSTDAAITEPRAVVTFVSDDSLALPHANVEQIVSVVRKLEDLPSIDALTSLFKSN